MIRSILAAIGLVALLVCLINTWWLSQHHLPLTVTTVTDIHTAVEHSQEIVLSVKDRFYHVR